MAGRRIDDHSSWIGKGDSKSVLPSGVHVKSYSSAEGAGELDRYCDTTEEIQRMQERGEKKISSHKMKDYDRN